jgi:flagellar protein FlaG
MKVSDPLPAVTAPAAAAGAKLANDPSGVQSADKPAPQTPSVDMNEAVRAAAKQIDSYLRSVGREVEFRVDEDTGMTVVTVRETATGDVIRQIPNEEMLQLARRFQQSSGALLDLIA